MREIDKTLSVNEALFEHLRKEGVAMQMAAGTTSITDCTGEESPATLWTVVDAPLSFTTKFRRGDPHLWSADSRVKLVNRPECGKGIGNHSPALGADRNDASLAARGRGNRRAQ